MRRGGGPLLAALGGAALLSSAGLAAAQQPPQAGPSGYTQQLDPAPAGDRFFRVPEARVRGVLDGYAMVLMSYGHRPLRNLDEGRGFVTEQLYGHLSLTLALAELGLLNVDLPVGVLSTGEDGFDNEPGPGLGDVRTTLRVGWLALAGHRLHLGTQLDLWFPTGDEDILGGDGAVRANPQLQLSGTAGRLDYALNAGYLFREHEQIGSAEIGGAVTFSAAVGASLWHGTLQLSSELYGHAVIPDSSELSFFDSRLTPVEALFGAKLRWGILTLGAAAGPGLTPAPTAAPYRVVGSLSLSPDDRVFDRDADGLQDEHDRCPAEPGFEPDGCPAPDRDGDSIADAEDACPDEPGLVHAEPPKHGCPP